MTFALDEQIMSQPEAVAQMLKTANVPTLNPGRPVVFAGIGTSFHACRVAAEWVADLTRGAVRPAAVGAHELALQAPLTAADQVVVVSHRGTKRFPNAVLAKARGVGAVTIAITGQGGPEPAADHVIRTCPDERAGTHTVSYLTALTALGRLVARLVGARGVELEQALAGVPQALTETLGLPGPDEAAERLLHREPLLITGFDLDQITAAEAALKLKEGTYTWAEGMPVELALHGPPAAYRPGMGAITITPSADDGGRTASLRQVLADIGVESLTCGDGAEDLRFARVPRLVRPLVAIVPLQRLTAALAHRLGTNPDLIHRDVEPWTTALGRVQL